MDLFRTQHHEIRNQLQEKKTVKKQKHVEAKRYGTKQPMDH